MAKSAKQSAHRKFYNLPDNGPPDPADPSKQEDLLQIIQYINNSIIGTPIKKVFSSTQVLKNLAPNQCCGSGMFIPDLGSWFVNHSRSRITDPKTSTKERGEKKNSCHTRFCSHKFHKIENYFIFEMLKKTIWPSFQRIIELFTQKFVTKYGFGIRVPISGIKPFPDPESRIRVQGSKRHRIPDPDPQHWHQYEQKCSFRLKRLLL
jgi:hypothetical protein